MLASIGIRLSPVLLGLLFFAGIASAQQSDSARGSAPSTAKGQKGHSDPAPASPAAPQVARARELFQAEKYMEAAEELKQAYIIEAKPVFLFNAGQAYRKAEQRKLALEMYESYVKVAPIGPLATEAEGYITELQAFLKAQANLTNVNLALETEQTELAQQKEKAQQLEVALSQARRKVWYKHPAFIATASTVGFALVAVGIVFLGLGAAGQTQGGTVVVTTRGN